jgi:hypothetical protein
MGTNICEFFVETWVSSGRPKIGDEGVEVPVQNEIPC